MINNLGTFAHPKKSKSKPQSGPTRSASFQPTKQLGASQQSYPSSMKKNTEPDMPPMSVSDSGQVAATPGMNNPTLNKLPRPKASKDIGSPSRGPKTKKMNKKPKAPGSSVKPFFGEY